MTAEPEFRKRRRYFELGSDNFLNGFDVNYITCLIERASDFYALPLIGLGFFRVVERIPRLSGWITQHIIVAIFQYCTHERLGLVLRCRLNFGCCQYRRLNRGSHKSGQCYESGQ